ncbi:hypothetical protein EES39_05765 [Streptomyces sp. ADI92-24]|nr:hypothetical protein EDD95_7787 [Streptomyces sp. CEV 2-1]RPK50328.1 hypothetical protein EES39_05765 [Streptomyces sp. ADI92-24]
MKLYATAGMRTRGWRVGNVRAVVMPQAATATKSAPEIIIMMRRALTGAGS